MAPFAAGDYALITGVDVVNIAVVADEDALAHLTEVYDRVVLVTGRDDRPGVGWRYNPGRDAFSAPPIYAVVIDGVVEDTIQTWDIKPHKDNLPPVATVVPAPNGIGPKMTWDGKKFGPDPVVVAIEAGHGPGTNSPGQPPVTPGTPPGSHP